MPIPKPRKDEDHDAFMGRCMGDGVMHSEYPDQKQRAAVCQTFWEDKEKKAMPAENLERRFLPLDACDLRASKDGKITGYAAVFNKRSVDLGGFREEIKPGAFAAVLATNPDVVCGIDHEGGLSTLGRTVSKTLQVQEDAAGLRYDVLVPETQAGKDARILIDRGDIRGSSFAFRLAPGGDTWTEEADGTTLRTITQIASLHDVSIVSRPAYPDTTVAVRSLEIRKAAAAQKSKEQEESERASLEALRMRLKLAERE